ncbi:MAG: DoxX-like family protein [Ferruginibacter sp.]|nr:DoxX-like family protein [Ferruginibacter sp.]
MLWQKIYTITLWFTALIWLINGLFCKVLNLVPRHTQIVENILLLSQHQAKILTILIGIAEVIMAIWIISKKYTKLNAITQILIIGIMNVLEFILVPNLLLWGKFNLLFAVALMLIIYVNEFVLSKKINV